MSEYKKTNLEFQKKIHNKKILENYKTSAEQWKKLYEKEHRKIMKALPLIQRHYPGYEQSELKSILENEDEIKQEKKDEFPERMHES